MAEYGSTDSGASLGDILGAALKRKQDDGDDQAESDKAESDEAEDSKAEEDDKAGES